MELIKRGINHFSQKTLATLLVILTIILFWLVYIISVKFEIPIRYFTADPLSLFDVNPLIGVVSNIGILLWCATTAVLPFTFILVIEKVSSKQISFLLYVAVITGLLLLDDFFMFHDRILLSLGIHELVMYGIYALLFGILIIRVLQNFTFSSLQIRSNYCIYLIWKFCFDRSSY